MTKDDKSLETLDSASQRLKYIIETLGVKQSRMAAKLGLSPSGLHYALNNKTKLTKNVKKIAEYLNINEDWLTSGKGEIYSENTEIKTYKIPVYFIDQLKLFHSTQQKIKIFPNDFLITTTNYKNNTLGLYITESTFNLKFEIGDIVAFEYTNTFKNGEILLAYLAKTNNIIIKNGIRIENETFLLSTSENTITRINTNEGDVILGAYRECLKKAK